MTIDTTNIDKFLDTNKCVKDDHKNIIYFFIVLEKGN